MATPKTTSIRIDKGDEEVLGQLGAFHGRPKAEELRRAVALYHTEAVLYYLGTPEAAAELGNELDAKREEVKADLAELIKATFRRPPLPPSSLN